ncbi:hypothetical protein [Bacillus sp. FJAT-45350]|uniref:hypothetical protein n=1 Tax=Bacillus sp. FJAT-45350 TaxID=2011014 RepID=UPI0015CB9B20|nr:hypothetical protein [Bacillus sp. FJAT-45350]
MKTQFTRNSQTKLLEILQDAYEKGQNDATLDVKAMVDDISNQLIDLVKLK